MGIFFLTQPLAGAVRCKIQRDSIDLPSLAQHGQSHCPLGEPISISELRGRLLTRTMHNKGRMLPLLKN